MSNLKKLEIVLNKIDYNNEIFIPKLWATWESESLNNNLVKGNLKTFLLKTIQSIYKTDHDYSCSLSKTKNILTGGDWIKESVAYSMLVRASTTFDHNQDSKIDSLNQDGVKETGTFIKTILLLPYLKRMGVSLLYLLPISKYSLKDRKGECGSVYGVSNFFKLDPNLKDPITGESMTLEEEFGALVEACHMLGIRVCVDIIPRTNSVNSDLIKNHPDWFYWIDYKDLENYNSPYVENIKPSTTPSEELLEKIYNSKEVMNHLDKFRLNPKEQDSKKWEETINYWEDNQDQYLLDVIRERFGLTVAPAFSDHVNDPQPPWSDVMFFRLYMDNPKASSKYLKKSYPPYVLFDTIKSNLFPGEVINEPLWELLSDIIPYYQNTFGVDGVRIDMGHALPLELVEKIIQKAKVIDNDFVFIAEEMDVNRARVSKEIGYNMIIGNGFWKLPRLEEGHTKDYYYNSMNVELPVFACGETHDTRRLATRDGEKKLSTIITALNMFMPNGVPFINSGQEIFEIQPMNLGIDCRVNEDEVLEKNNTFYKKLALFDKYQFHYKNADETIIRMLNKLSIIRNDYLKSITSNKEVSYISDGLGFIYEINEKDLLVVIANDDLSNSRKINLLENKHIDNVTILYSLSDMGRANLLDNMISVDLIEADLMIFKVTIR